jgi:hypothetical protein
MLGWAASAARTAEERWTGEPLFFGVAAHLKIAIP